MSNCKIVSFNESRKPEGFIGTINQIIDKKGWNFEVDAPVFRYMNVQIGFINAEGYEDEVEFSIKAYDLKDLNDLFNIFCKENHIKRKCVFSVTVSQVANRMQDLN